MKKILVLCLAVLMVIAMAACSSDSGTETSAEASTDAAAEASSDTAGGDAAGDDAEGTPMEGPMHITLITMDQMDAHWVKLEKAAKEEVAELQSQGLDIEYEWLAPEKKDNAQQIQQIETAINNGSNAIVIAVNDTTACNDALQQALDRGIKLVYVDATADLPASATFATDNYQAGVQAGEAMAGYLKEAGVTSGEIGIVGAQPGNKPGLDRCEGFASVFDGTDFTTSEIQFSDGDAAKAQELANALINDGCVALFGANEGSTTGTANAAKEANASGKDIICVGFDNSSATRGLTRDGAMLAFMAQNPDVMGKESIKAAVDLLQGKPVDSTPVDTGATVVTLDNIDDFED